jgi:putative redox protein
MSDLRIEARWDDTLRFEAVGRGGMPVVVDGDGAAGPSPVELLLVGLAACMGVDVVDLLRKMRVPMSGLTVVCEADRRPSPPRRLTAVRLTYRAEGVADPDQGKLRRAVELSRDTYCSVLHSLQPDLDLDIRIEDGGASTP